MGSLPKKIRTTAILNLVVLASSGAIAQSLPVFDVASVRMSRNAAGRGSAEFSLGGERFTATNTSLGQLILIAYGITPLQVGPFVPPIYGKYDIQANVEHPVTRKEVLMMLQALLRDRFNLRTHWETRQLPTYALRVNKQEPKLKLSKEQIPWNLSRLNGNEIKHGQMIFQSESMQDFASVLSTLVVVGRVVVDETGLTGQYDFALNFAPPDGITDFPTNESAPSIFTAMKEQLGLRLDPRRAPIQFLVIEHVERASEN